MDWSLHFNVSVPGIFFSPQTLFCKSQQCGCMKMSSKPSVQISRWSSGYRVQDNSFNEIDYGVCGKKLHARDISLTTDIISQIPRVGMCKNVLWTNCSNFTMIQQFKIVVLLTGLSVCRKKREFEKRKKGKWNWEKEIT